MSQSAETPTHHLPLTRGTDGASRHDILKRLAALFDESGADVLDWDALRHSKQHAWPMPEQTATPRPD